MIIFVNKYIFKIFCMQIIVNLNHLEEESKFSPDVSIQEFVSKDSIVYQRLISSAELIPMAGDRCLMSPCLIFAEHGKHRESCDRREGKTSRNLYLVGDNATITSLRCSVSRFRSPPDKSVLIIL